MEFSYLSDITGNYTYREKVEKARAAFVHAQRYICDLIDLIFV